jgi:hypothetical protein
VIEVFASLAMSTCGHRSDWSQGESLKLVLTPESTGSVLFDLSVDKSVSNQGVERKVAESVISIHTAMLRQVICSWE